MSEQPIFDESIADGWSAVQSAYDGHELRLKMELWIYAPKKNEQVLVETKRLCFRHVPAVNVQPPVEAVARFREKPPVLLRGCLFIFFILLYPFGMRRTEPSVDTAEVMLANIASHGGEVFTSIYEVTGGFLVYGTYGYYYVAADEVGWCEEIG